MTAVKRRSLSHRSHHRAGSCSAEAAHACSEVEHARVLAELGFNLAHLCGIADDRGWSLAISVIEDHMTLHAFLGPPPRRSDKTAWLMPPAGEQLALAPVYDLDFDRAAIELYAMALQEWT